MSRRVMRCPKCEHQEMIMSSRPGAASPPCPRCEGSVKMVDVTPSPDQAKNIWRSAGSSAVSANSSEKTGQKKRDDRDYGPEPRV